jgi:hypothetical protein
MISLIKKQGKFDGTWNGFYSYDNDDTFGPNDKIPFKMVLRDVGAGKITGAVEDDVSQGGVEGQATITGYIKDTEVYFEKKMPGPVAVGEDDTAVADDSQDYIIYYRGLFDAEKNRFSGTWLVEGGLVGEGDKIVRMEDTTGTWEMGR